MRPQRVPRLVLALAAALAAVACSDDEPTGPDPIPLEETVFAPELDVDLDRMQKTSSGVYYEDIVVGDGEEVVVDSEITFHYKLWLPDGTLVFDSRDPEGDGSVEGEPTTAQLSLGVLIRGWVEGVPGMRVGGTRKLVVPWQLAYGANPVRDGSGRVVIPAYSNLVYEVEVLESNPPQEAPGQV